MAVIASDRNTPGFDAGDGRETRYTAAVPTLDQPGPCSRDGCQHTPVSNRLAHRPEEAHAVATPAGGFVGVTS